jgi:hypothetical protein
VIDTTGVVHVCHHCGDPAEVQWLRHATDAEAAAHWDALERRIIESGNPAYVQDRTGPVHKVVYGCGDHELPMPCDHPEPGSVPCPVCQAEPDASCTKRDSSPRREHRGRAEAQPEPETCRHAHNPDCGGYGGCTCAATDAVLADTVHQTPAGPGRK